MTSKFESKPNQTGKAKTSRWDRRWMRQFEYLMRFRNKNSHEWPSTLEEFPKGNRIGQWLNRQRDLQSRKQLPKYRVRLLDKISLPMEKTDERASRWDEQLRFLKEYRRAHPNRWPFAREEFPKGNRLGLWVWRQRQNFALKKLEKNRQEDLLKLDFPLALPDRWESHYKTLKEYRIKHPQAWPKAREEFPEGNRLGLWCHLQRCAFKANKLPSDHISKMNRIGFPWSVKHLSWTKYYEQLKEYKRKYPAKWPLLEAASLEDKKLTSWCSAQRHKRKLKKLDRDKSALLDKLGFRW